MTASPSQRWAWRSADLAASSSWILPADKSLLALTPEQLCNWSLPMQKQLKHGTGVVLIRGLQDLEESDFRQLYFHLGRCIGRPDTTYGTLYDVTDNGESHLAKAIPVSQTKAATSMHTDSSRKETHPRWVGLACVRQAPFGGGSRLASVLAVVEHLQRHDPTSLERLGRLFHRDVVTPGAQDPLQLIDQNRFPILCQAEDGPTLRYMRFWIEKGHERIGQPLSDQDIEAFDALDAALNHPELCHKFQLQEGDILFVDNHKIAHDREEFHDDPQRPRLLIRLWLNPPN